MEAIDDTNQDQTAPVGEPWMDPGMGNMPDWPTDYRYKVMSQLDGEGYFLGPTRADESPLEPGVFLIPGGAIPQDPPDPIEPGKCYKPDGADGWIEIEDNRESVLFLTITGEPYTFGVQVGAMAYDGRGPVPGWLTPVPRPDGWSIWDGSTWKRDQASYDLAMQAAAGQEKAARMAIASQTITTLQDAVDLGMATVDETQRLLDWKMYRVLLSRVDVAQLPPAWPAIPGT